MDPHARHSSYVERLVEHVFIGELLRIAWAKGHARIEVLRPEVDASGYDLVLGYGGVMRPVQLKARREGGRRSEFEIRRELGVYPGACVIVIDYSAERFQPVKYGFFGDSSQANGPLPSLEELPSGVRPRDGVKRDDTCLLGLTDFTWFNSTETLLEALFPNLAVSEQKDVETGERSGTVVSNESFEVICGDSHSVWRTHQLQQMHLRMFDALHAAANERPERAIRVRIRRDDQTVAQNVRLRAISDVQLSWSGNGVLASSKAPIVIRIERL